MWIHTNEARSVPEELPYPYWPHRFHSERYTRCETRDQWGRLQVAEVYDDWRVQRRGLRTGRSLGRRFPLVVLGALTLVGEETDQGTDRMIGVVTGTRGAPPTGKV